jgi:hypothetical protein
MYYLVLVFAMGNIKVTIEGIESLKDCKKLEASFAEQAPDAISEGCKKK